MGWGSGQCSLTPHSQVPSHPPLGHLASLTFSLSLSDLPPSLFTFELSRPALPLQSHSQSHLSFCPRPQHRPSISTLTCAENLHPALFLAHIRAQGWTDEPTTYHVKEVLEILLLFSMVNWLVFNPPAAATAYHPTVCFSIINQNITVNIYLCSINKQIYNTYSILLVHQLNNLIRKRN